MVPVVLVPVDGSPEAEGAVRCAAELAEAARAKVILLATGAGPGDGYPLEAAVAVLRAHLVRVEAITSPTDSARAISRTARFRGVDLVVMAPQAADPRGALGPLADAVVRRCPVPVLLPHPGNGCWSLGGTDRPTAVVAYDGSPDCKWVLPAVYKLAKWMPLSVRLVGLVEDDEAATWDMLEELRRFSLSFALAEVETELDIVETGDSVGAARALSEEPGDLVVLPVHGDWPGEGGTFGCLTASIVRSIHRSMMLVRVESFVPAGSPEGCLHPA